jgi:NADH-quinone oxidoreductase subunit J
MRRVDNTRAIGRVLYTQYFYLFQVAGWCCWSP